MKFLRNLLDIIKQKIKRKELDVRQKERKQTELKIQQTWKYHVIDIKCIEKSLTDACKNKNLNIIKYLVETEEKIHKHYDELTQECADKNYLDLVSFLLARKKDLMINHAKYIHLSVKIGDLETVKYFMKSTPDSFDLHNVFVIAVKNNQYDIVKFLFSKKN